MRLVEVSEEVLRPDLQMRLEDAAGLVGCARTTLYYYFSGRDDLIAFLLEEHLAAAADAIAAATPARGSPAARLRATVGALVAFFAQRPGVCAGLLSFAGESGRMSTLLAAKDMMIAAPLREVFADGVAAGRFVAEDPRDAVNAVLGATMITLLDRWHRGDDCADARFQRALIDQIIHGVQRRN